MHWLLIGYMFLFIHRPFEVWPVLGDLRVERVYMLGTLLVWAVSSGKRWLPNAQHVAYAGFAGAVVLGWVVSPWMDQGQPVVEDWFKIVVFYVLLVTTVSDEKGLKRLVAGFICVMGVYLLHSLKEYQAGRHTYRMGIARMIGVDTTLGDPNSFGASIVFALPFIACLWRAGVAGRAGKLALSGYAGLSVVCVLLTGSRSSLIGLVAYGLILVMGSRRRWRFLALAACAAPVAFVALPPSLQTRFETIIDPDVGPANAKQSGEGRIQGLFMGLDLWAGNPLTGVGPGAWRPATRQPIESHNLYGQLAGELGTAGVLTFGAVVGCFVLNLRRVGTVRLARPEWQNELPCQVASAVAVGLFLLLFMGNFGHNLFRFSWLWYGGFLIIARHVVQTQAAEADALDADAGEYDWEQFEDEAAEPESASVPAGWSTHPGHARPGAPV